MRASSFLLVAGAVSVLAWSGPARAQVGDAERAAARELFRQGDELQRAGKIAEALDKFNRAQQVFPAPTNQVRIAECDAALGRLVESAETYRAVVRTSLPAGSPAAFTAAVEQAKAELAQVEPRVPKIVVLTDPPSVPQAQLQIDGQSVPAALLGEQIPLDPGPHRVSVQAPGLAAPEQSVVLKERETKSVTLALKPAPGTLGPPAPVGGAPPPGATRPVPPAAEYVGDGSAPPPPPLVEGGAIEPARKASRVGLLLGLHLGVELPTGQIPVGSALPAIDMTTVSGTGFAYALEGGVRFARQWYIGLTVEHANLGGGRDVGVFQLGAQQVSSNTTTAGLVLGLIVNPDRASFFGELGAQGRWYGINWTDPAGRQQSSSYNGAELLLGAGVWIPVGRSFRIVPEATASIGTFTPPDVSSSGSSNNSSGVGHAFFMLGVAGLFNLDL